MYKAVLVFVASISWSLAAADGARITGGALVSSFAGKTYSGTAASGGAWEAVYAADGSYTVRMLNSNWSDEGRWEMKDDRICTERTKRARMCYEVMRVSDDEYHWIDERGETTKSSGPK